MKKIKRIQDLKNEKKRIAQSQVDLLNKIKNNWHELKLNMYPRNMTNNMIEKMANNRTDTGIYNESILKKSLTYALLLFAEKFAGKLNDKVQSIIKKQH